jgi:hypothetical protein
MAKRATKKTVVVIINLNAVFGSSIIYFEKKKKKKWYDGFNAKFTRKQITTWRFKLILSGQDDRP